MHNLKFSFVGHKRTCIYKKDKKYNKSSSSKNQEGKRLERKCDTKDVGHITQKSKEDKEKKI